MVGYGSGPPLSGIHAPGNSLTSAGSASEPMQSPRATGAIDPRQQVALAMLQQQLARTQQMGQRGLMGLGGQRQATVDQYGNPVQ